MNYICLRKMNTQRIHIMLISVIVISGDTVGLA